MNPNQRPDGASLHFFSLFRHLWMEGSGRDPRIMPNQKSWTPPLFHRALHGAGYPVDSDTVRLWAKGHQTGRPLPSRDNIDGIIKVFDPNGNDGNDLRHA